MANLFTLFRERVSAAIGELVAEGHLPPGLDLAPITLEPPRDPAHGDIATNAALILARPAKRKPREIAELLSPLLARDPSVAAVEVAGPGFINLRLGDAFWQAALREALAAGPSYGDSSLGQGRTVNLEYVSANPTGPLHVGHCRGAVFGDALAALLEKAGYRVCREYYINDAGAQVDVLARSAYLRYREALGERIETIPEGLYPGEYLKPVGAALAAEFGREWLDQPEAKWLVPCRQAAIAAMMGLIRADLVALGIRHEVFISERALHEAGKVEHAVATLEVAGLLYTGILEPPKGRPSEEWEPREQLLFRATDFGDDSDRPLRKSDGAWTYFAADIAYHLDKFERGFAQMIDVWGADHGGYVKRIEAAVAALSARRATLDVKICQLVNLLDGGLPVKMSKRAGNFVTLRDVVDEVGRDVVRFIMLTRRNDAPLDFDFARVREQSKDNPVFYVQYAHARVRSVLRHAAAELERPDLAVPGRAAQGLGDADLARLTHPAELALMKLLAGWPRVVEAAAEAHEPHRVAFYLYDLASSFHALWNLGKEDTGLRFISAADRSLTLARLALIQAVAGVIASGLAVMGVEPAEEMR